jgi:hypothetical protein
MALTQVSRGLLSTSIVDNGNDTAITIDSSENVGIGASPSTKLQVTGNSSSRNTIVSNVTLDGGTTVAYPYSGFGFGINFIGRDYGNAVRNYASINTVMEATSSNSGGGDAGFKAGLSFYTNGGGASDTDPQERLRIDNSGIVLVGRTSAGATGNGHSIRGGDSAIFSRDSSGESMIVARNASAGDLVRFYCNGSDRGSIDFDGTNTISYTSSSDQRLKDNIADADDAGSKVDAIQVRKFDWKVNGTHQDYGMIAQELQTVAPEAVSGDPDSDEMMGVDYSKLVPMLVKEIQSLRARVAQLENN